MQTHVKKHRSSEAKCIAVGIVFLKQMYKNVAILLIK